MRRALTTLLLTALCLSNLGFEWEGRLSRLRRDLATGDAARRTEVLRLMRSYAADTVAEPLMGALSDPEASVRAQAAETAGHVRLASAVPVLLDWLDDPEADIRTTATRALGRIGDERTVPSLVRALGDSNADVRGAAVGALSAIGSPEVVVPLLGRLDDDDATVRGEAAHALGRLGDPRSVVPLIGRARDDAPEVREAVFGALGALRDPRAVPALVQGLDDGEEGTRLAAIAGLGQLGSTEAVEALQALLSRPDPRLSRAVVSALAAIGGPSATRSLVDSLAQQETREIAALALVEAARRPRAMDAEPGRDPFDARALLTEALDGTASHLHATAIADVLLRLARAGGADPSVAPALLRALRARRGAPATLMKALAASGSPDALVPLLEYLRSDEAAMTAAALEALELYFADHPGDGRAADPLLAALGPVAPAQRVRVVRLLGRVRAARALPALRPLLAHDDDDIRLAAVQAIGDIGDPEGAPALLRLLEDPSGRTRFEAARALAAAASAETVVTLCDRLAGREPFDRHAVVLALGGALERLARAGTLSGPARAAALASLEAATRSPDVALATAAIAALAQWGDAASTPTLVDRLEDRAPAVRRQAATALGTVDGPEARAALRRAMRSPEHAVAVAATAVAGERGDASDVALLLEVSEGRWPRPPAAAFALARLARRGRLDDAPPVDGLCRLARSRDPHVRANAAVALAALGGPMCPDGPRPSDWLETGHADAVRSAAARWLAAAARGGHAPAAEVAARLSDCAESDLSAAVVAVCREPSMPALDSVADVYAYAADGRQRLRDRLMALRLADGTVLVARTDPSGRLRLDGAPAGPLGLDDPVGAPLEP